MTTLNVSLIYFECLAAITHKTAIPKPKPSEPTPDVGTSLLMFETGIQNWITSLKQASLEMTNPAASDYLWTSFRNWLSSETLKIKVQSYEQVQQNFSDMLQVFEDQVLSHLLNKEILPLDNAPWSEHRLSDEVQPESEGLTLTTAPEEMISAEEMVHYDQAAEC